MRVPGWIHRTWMISTAPSSISRGKYTIRILRLPAFQHTIVHCMPCGISRAIWEIRIRPWQCVNRIRDTDNFFELKKKQTFSKVPCLNPHSSTSAPMSQYRPIRYPQRFDAANEFITVINQYKPERSEQYLDDILIKFIKNLSSSRMAGRVCWTRCSWWL